MASGQEYNLADKKSAWKTVVFIFHTILMSVILQIRPQHLFTPPHICLFGKENMAESVKWE